MKEKFKVKTIKIFLCFLALMFIMSFVSRMIYSSRLPRVTTIGVKNQAIKHTVECRGTLEAVNKNPVFVDPGLRVAQVFVNKGDSVTNGAVLMQLDQQYLQETIDSLQKQLDDEICDSPDAYSADKKTPVFTEPGLRAAEVCVKPGDHVESGDILVRLDTDFLNSFINGLVDDLNGDYTSRAGFYDAEDSRSADAISFTIAGKERTLQKYNDIAAHNGEIRSSCAGTVTEVNIRTGSVTDDSAAICISDNARLKSSALSISKRLDKLKAAADSEGKITCCGSGVITEVYVKPGDITTETGAFIISDVFSGMLFRASIDSEDTKYLAAGDLVSLSFHSGKISLDECEVKNLLKNETDDSYYVEIPVENEELKTGETGEMVSTALSVDKYNCVPVSAVTEENEKGGYIYVLEETEGFLGPEYHVHKEKVNIEDKNDEYFGLSELTSDNDTAIVLSSSKELSDGQAVSKS